MATEDDPTRTKRATASTVSPDDSPPEPMVTPPVRHRARFFGLTPDRSTPSPRAFAGLMVSIADIHFGVTGSWPARGRERHSLTANRTAAAPRTTLRTLTKSDE